MADNVLDKEIRAKIGKDDPKDLVKGQHQIGPPKGAHQGSTDGCSRDGTRIKQNAFKGHG